MLATPSQKTRGERDDRGKANQNESEGARKKENMRTPDSQPPPPVRTPVQSGIKHQALFMSPEAHGICMSSMQAAVARSLASKSDAKDLAIEALRLQMIAAEEAKAEKLIAADEAKAEKQLAADEALALKLTAAREMGVIAKAYGVTVNEDCGQLTEYTYQLNEMLLFGSGGIAGKELLPELTPHKVLGNTDQQLTTPSSELKNHRGRKTPRASNKNSTTVETTSAVSIPKTKRVRLKKAFFILPTFAFYPRQEFKKSTMLRIAGREDKMVWDFQLGKHVTELLAKQPGNIYIHGYRCEEFHLLPGIRDGTSVPFFVATCMPPGAPAPCYVLVKDANKETNVSRVIGMNDLPLKWESADGSDRVFVLHPSSPKMRGMDDERKKLVEAALIGGHVFVPGPVDYKMNPLTDFIFSVPGDTLFVDDFNWEEWLKKLKKTKAVESMEVFWTADNDKLFGDVVTFCTEKFAELFSDELEESSQPALREGIHNALLSHKYKLADEQTRYNSVSDYISDIQHFKIYPENEMLGKVLSSSKCNKLPSGAVTAVFPDFTTHF